jgi:hypothetical protein
MIVESTKEGVHMNMPGFSADASLTKARRYHHTLGTGTAHTARIAPQTGAGWLEEQDSSMGLSPAAARRVRIPSCILTIDGGLWCCIQGPKQPICWKVPPPPIIAT